MLVPPSLRFASLQCAVLAACLRAPALRLLGPVSLPLSLTPQPISLYFLSPLSSLCIPFLSLLTQIHYSFPFASLIPHPTPLTPLSLPPLPHRRSRRLRRRVRSLPRRQASFPGTCSAPLLLGGGGGVLPRLLLGSLARARAPAPCAGLREVLLRCGGIARPARGACRDSARFGGDAGSRRVRVREPVSFFFPSFFSGRLVLVSAGGGGSREPIWCSRRPERVVPGPIARFRLGGGGKSSPLVSWGSRRRSWASSTGGRAPGRRSGSGSAGAGADAAAAVAPAGAARARHPRTTTPRSPPAAASASGPSGRARRRRRRAGPRSTPPPAAPARTAVNVSFSPVTWIPYPPTRHCALFAVCLACVVDGICECK